MNLVITYLKNYPEHVPLLARWAFNAWGQYNPNSIIERAKSKLEEHLNDDKLPLTMIALRDHKPIGMCSLRVNDGIRPDLSPWLGSLFVEPSARGQGVGEQLIRAVIEKAQNMRYSNLYFLTFDDTLPKWYEKLGWKLIGIDELNG